MSRRSFLKVWLRSGLYCCDTLTRMRQRLNRCAHLHCNRAVTAASRRSGGCHWYGVGCRARRLSRTVSRNCLRGLQRLSFSDVTLQVRRKSA